jgi:hypothetical protein
MPNAPDTPSSLDTSSETSNPFKDAGVCTLCACFLLSLITLAVVFGRPAAMHPGHASLLFAVGGVLPFFVVGATLVWRRSMLAAGAANALAWATIIISLLLTVIGFIASIMSLTPLVGLIPVIGFIAYAAIGLHDVMNPGGYVIIAVLFALSFFLLRLTRIARRTVADTTARKQWRSGSQLLWTYAVLGFPLYMRFVDAEGERRMADEQTESSEIAQSTAEVSRALSRVQGCLFKYQATHPEHEFPAVMNSLGSAPRSSSCLNAATAGGVRIDAQIRYLPTKGDSTDRIDGFWLTAEPTGRARWKNVFYASNDGLLYISQMKEIDDSLFAAGREVTAPVPMPWPRELEITGSPVQRLFILRDCLKTRGGGTAPRRFPADMRGSCVDRQDFSIRGTQSLMLAPGQYSSKEGEGYSVRYLPQLVPGDTTKASAFELEARPATYGIGGVRSYLFEQNGAVHWTREDRSPTTRDPLVTGCEVDITAPCPPEIALTPLRT